MTLSAKQINKYEIWGVLTLVLVFGMALTGCEEVLSSLSDNINYTATANGASNSENSTRIYFIFDRAVSGLTANDITLIDGTGSATRGSLTGAGTSWTLNITVVQQGTITVKINKFGVRSLSKTVTVNKAGG